MPALKQDLFRMLTLNSCCSIFSEPFPVLLPKPESFQLFPQCSRILISSGPWVEISLAMALLHEQPCLLGHLAELPRAVPMLLSGHHVDKSRLKGLGTGRKTQVMGSL